MKTTKTGLPILTQEELSKFLEVSTKGVIILGNVGVGKTHLLNEYISKNYSNYKNFQLLWSTDELVDEYDSSPTKQKHIQELLQYQFQNRIPLFLDDLGTEEVLGYGVNRIDVIKRILYRVYRDNIKFYGTSNLNMEELKERYGTRIVNRIKDRFHIIVLEGKDWREESYSSNLEEAKKIYEKIQNEAHS